MRCGLDSFNDHIPNQLRPMTQPDLFGALPPPPRKLTNLDLAKIAFTEFREALRSSIHQPPSDPRQLLQLETDVQLRSGLASVMSLKLRRTWLRCASVASMCLCATSGKMVSADAAKEFQNK